MRQGNRTFRYAAAALLAGVAMVLAGVACAENTRIKDLGKVQGWRENALVGYGIVTGLAGTGDSPTNRTTRQALSNVFSQFNLTVPPEQVQSRNVAVVMVSASLPPFAREGDTLDVTVSSAGDARSLVGGSLLVTPLKGPNGRIYALAQGALSVGGIDTTRMATFCRRTTRLWVHCRMARRWRWASMPRCSAQTRP